MANSTIDAQETKRKPAARAKAAVKSVAANVPEETPAVTTAPTEVVETKPVVVAKSVKVKPELNPEDFVVVRNGFHGRLVYKSRNNGETYVWDAFGAEQEMELRELKHARNSAKSFFSNNWFMFEDPAVVEWLGVGMFYKNSLDIEEIDELFTMRPGEVEQTVKLLPAGQKETIAIRARQLIADGDVDSIRLIEALERSLNVKLPRR